MLLVRSMIIIKYYKTSGGAAPFAKWFDGLDATQANRVATAIGKLAAGDSVRRKALKQSLHELKITSGGGLRIYFYEDGEDMVVLLGGGQKDSQARDIETARKRLVDYLARKEQEDGSATDR